MSENEVRAAAVREAKRYIERIYRRGLQSRDSVLMDLEAIAERMEQGMTARGSTRVVAEEPEWEYGIRAEGDDDPYTDHSDDPDWLCDQTTPEPGDAIVRRRKASPWAPIEPEGRAS